ncbi:MAG: peptide chain release factor N(5)-glutamine methyltransferase [Candidatus Aminicenantes bacterium]|nr:peptide chain release factor N(5)-glutamine methyltransferase [Candidatus Aminicenantes bacterium]
MATVRDLLRGGAEALAGIPGLDPALEARILLRRTGRLTELEILAYPERPVAAGFERKFWAAVKARRSGRPLAYIIEEKEFWSIPLTVGPAVLIPRPESELLVERALGFCRRKDPLILEIGTGSGCLAVALAKELPASRILATDVSRRALRLASSNADRHGAANVTFLHGRLFGPFRGRGLEGRADFVVSNPPYIAEAEWPDLPEAVRRAEPRRALIAGPTGLEVIRGLVRGAPRFLKKGGRLVFEIGAGQADAVRPLFGRRWDEVEVSLDWGGRPRVVTARRHV